MKQIITFFLLIQISLLGMGQNENILSFCKIPREVLDNNFLPYLVSLEFKKFTPNLGNLEQQSGWVKDESNLGFKGLNPKNRFEIEYAVTSENNNYIGTYHKNPDGGKITILKNNAINEPIHTLEITRNDFVGMALANSVQKLVLCFLNEKTKSYELEYHELQTEKKEALLPIFFNNLKLIQTTKPLLFFNKAETIIGVLPPTPPKLKNKDVTNGICLRALAFTLFDLFKYTKIIKNSLHEPDGPKK